MLSRQFKFYKNTSDEWYLDLPEWKGDPTALQMVEGADSWLDLLSKGARSIQLHLSDSKFEQAEILTLMHVRAENLGGGGFYYLEKYEQEHISLKLWLCEVTRFVFNKIPQRIYFKAIEPIVSL